MFDLAAGFVTLFSDPEALLFVFAGAFVGIIFGALPGLTASAAIAMLLPLSFFLNPLSALSFLYVIGKSGRYGGSIAAILFNTPGTAASAATMLDGYPLAQRGEGGKALRTATIASVVGDFCGELILIFGAVFIAGYTKSFGPAEYFAIYTMAFVVIGSVVGDSVIKGIISTLLGGLIAMIGLDVISNTPRLTFGFMPLEEGLAIVPLLTGLFVVSEVIIQAEKGLLNVSGGEVRPASPSASADYMTWGEFKHCLPVILRSSVIGSIIGIIPGLGSSVACFVAYGEEKRRSKHPELWGTGLVEGVAAPESANNAVSGPSMIPLLTLGIPGSTIAAILIGLFLVHGIPVGPTIFDTPYSRSLIFALFAAGLLGIAAYGAIGYWLGPLIGRTIALLPPRLLYPFIMLTALAASYSARSSITDVFVALLFGLAGYLMRRTGFSVAAFIIAFVLARSMEETFRQSLLISDNGMMIFLTEPVSLGFLLLGGSVMAYRAIGALRRRL